MQTIEEALTFDDVLLVPGYSELLPSEADLQTPLTREISMHLPLVGAAMDTVTEASLAIALGQEGGIGIVHKNMTVEQQAREIETVKKYESGIIKNPITVSPETTIREVLDITRRSRVSGVPVVDGDNLEGIVTSRDLRFVTTLDRPVASIMTGKDRLVTVREGADTSDVAALLHEHRIEKVLVVDEDFKLRGMITVKDIQKASDFPLASKDAHGSIRVGAAVGAGEGSAERVEALTAAGVDVVVVDTAHGHSRGVVERVRWIKQHFPDVQVVAGNIATSEAARALADSGVDAVKVGIGPGSICTTRVVAGVGMPQITAIANAASGLDGTGVPLIADGGVRFSGDLAKALAAGADSVMVGSLFAGTEEAPGEIELYQGRSYKAYRGMGSLGAMSGSQGSSDRYFQESVENVDKLVPEGIEGRVPYKGSVVAIIHQLMGGLRASMGYTGCRTIADMHSRPHFVRVTGAGVREGHVHDVNITKESPNYWVDRG